MSKEKHHQSDVYVISEELYNEVSKYDVDKNALSVHSQEVREKLRKFEEDYKNELDNPDIRKIYERRKQNVVDIKNAEDYHRKERDRLIDIIEKEKEKARNLPLVWRYDQYDRVMRAALTIEKGEILLTVTEDKPSPPLPI